VDEELRRMSDVVDRLTPTSTVLCNESFAATNESEGSEIARQVVRAMLEWGVRVVFVTHLYDLAPGWYRHDGDQALFLRAERQADGTRTYVLTEGKPLPTSFGPDLYERVFGG
jgi:DNA mismatch repair ATPase MutS